VQWKKKVEKAKLSYRSRAPTAFKEVLKDYHLISTIGDKKQVEMLIMRNWKQHTLNSP
jgi:hypothetical protein